MNNNNKTPKELIKDIETFLQWAKESTESYALAPVSYEKQLETAREKKHSAMMEDFLEIVQNHFADVDTIEELEPDTLKLLQLFTEEAIHQLGKASK